MPIKEEVQTGKPESTDDEFSVSFTHGALKQLRDLKVYFKAEDELSVIKLGISLLQKTKEEPMSFI